jgi:hypothetical protein
MVIVQIMFEPPSGIGIEKLPEADEAIKTDLTFFSDKRFIKDS